jgi:EAL domain-containing protein (putative c-di-GMP-specific phosphodiesterase class I)
MSNGPGIEVIAEIVKTREQLEYYKPMPASVFEAVLEQSSECIMAGSGQSHLKPVN